MTKECRQHHKGTLLYHTQLYGRGSTLTRGITSLSLIEHNPRHGSRQVIVPQSSDIPENARARSNPHRGACRTLSCVGDRRYLSEESVEGAYLSEESVEEGGGGTAGSRMARPGRAVGDVTEFLTSVTANSSDLFRQVLPSLGHASLAAINRCRSGITRENRTADCRADVGLLLARAMKVLTPTRQVTRQQ